VADEDDRKPFGHQARQRREQRLALLRREHRRRLVEDQDARIPIERLQDLDALALAHRERADARRRIDAQPEALGRRGELRARGGAVRARRPQRLRAEQHVVLDREVVGQREVLVHHADAGSERRGGIAPAQRFAECGDGARVGDIVAEQDRDERRLAGAVLAEQREHFAATKLERDRVVSDDVAEALADAERRRTVSRESVTGATSLRRRPGLGLDGAALR
jgi:hypothetical protein